MRAPASAICFLALAVVGMGAEPPEGVEILPTREGSSQLARVSSECLLGNWKHMGGVPSEGRLA